MKWISLILILSINLAVADPVPYQSLLDGIGEQAANLHETVEAATLPQGECHLATHHRNRDVLNPDRNVPVEVCPPDRSTPPATTEEIERLINEYNITFFPTKEEIVGTRDFQDFIIEFKKFPSHLLRQMRDAGSEIRLIHGNGVADDTRWAQELQRILTYIENKYRRDVSARQREIDRATERYEGSERQQRIEVIIQRYATVMAARDKEIADARSGYENTSDGARSWTYTSGAGGNFSSSDRGWHTPTRIVVNHMYQTSIPRENGPPEIREEGSTNLFLHEHAHALDNFFRAGTISGSDEWKNLIARPEVDAYLKNIFSDYEYLGKGEGFAEAFSYYFACETSKNQMIARAPKMAEFFEKLQTQSMETYRNP